MLVIYFNDRGIGTPEDVPASANGVLYAERYVREGRLAVVTDGRDWRLVNAMPSLSDRVDDLERSVSGLFQMLEDVRSSGLLEVPEASGDCGSGVYPMHGQDQHDPSRARDTSGSGCEENDLEDGEGEV